METVVLSDMHLTEAEEGTRRRPLWMAYKRRAHFIDADLMRLLDHVEAEVEGPIELVLNGDVFELSLARHNVAFQNTREFFRRLNEADLFEQVVYLPGNHDMSITEELVNDHFPGIVFGGRAANQSKYRTSRLVAEHDFGEGFKRYEHRLSRDPVHEHLICQACGRVQEFEIPEITAIEARVARELGFRPQRHRVEIYGLCSVCRERGVALPQDGLTCPIDAV